MMSRQLVVMIINSKIFLFYKLIIFFVLQSVIQYKENPDSTPVILPGSPTKYFILHICSYLISTFDTLAEPEEIWNEIYTGLLLHHKCILWLIHGFVFFIQRILRVTTPVKLNIYIKKKSFYKVLWFSYTEEGCLPHHCCWLL